MLLKQQVAAWLRAGDRAALAEALAGDPRVIRHLVARLWDVDAGIRRQAAEGLGEAAVRHPTLLREVIRRLLWSLNDESATNGAPALAALGAIGRRAPELVASYVPALVALAADGGLRRDLIGALAEVACTAPEVIAPHWAALVRVADMSCPAEAEALAALRNALKGTVDEYGNGYRTD